MLYKPISSTHAALGILRSDLWSHFWSKSNELRFYDIAETLLTFAEIQLQPQRET